jgi:hypothetical protein
MEKYQSVFSQRGPLARPAAGGLAASSAARVTRPWEVFMGNAPRTQLEERLSSGVVGRDTLLIPSSMLVSITSG